MKKLLTFCLIFISTILFSQKYAEVALTPPMGWNSWNKFACNINETIVKEVADAMVTSGMKDAGYEYIVIDDCWQIDRDSIGNIIIDPDRFPSGMKSLADYIHSKGLKFGIYSDAGIKTCQGRPGSRGYEFQDARTYAAWEVDYLKYDWCYHGKQNPEASYSLMRDALALAGRPIVFSICEWGSNKPWLWAKDIGHLWRTTEDILNCWDCKEDWGGMGWPLILDKQDGLEKYAGPGHWNDPDMLEVGNSGLTFIESKAHFSLWCMLAAPLMAGNDLRNMSEETRDILTNKEVIAIDQDALGKQGFKIIDEGDFEIWKKPLINGDIAICLFNRGKKTIEKEIIWDELNISKNFEIRDLWMKKNIGKTNNNFKTEIVSHSVVMLRLSLKKL
ncbi:MAG: glycoside hydrolase family 27 protein [Bacteroidales bacterium]|nr:glycoside hydrolase family 27 protein [Bacteroidales bacterium]